LRTLAGNGTKAAMPGYRDGPHKETIGDVLTAALLGLSLIAIGSWSMFRSGWGTTAFIWLASFIVLWAAGVIWRAKRVAKKGKD